MRVLLYFFLPTIFIAGCGQPDLDVPDLDDLQTLNKITAEAIDYKNLQQKGKKGGKLFYAPNEQKPYTGWARLTRDNGSLIGIFQIKEGKRGGLELMCYKDGKRESVGIMKEDEKGVISLKVWKPNGEKCPISKIENGNGILVVYNDDGTEKHRLTYKDGWPDLWD